MTRKEHAVTRNRRLTYLEQNPHYFSNENLHTAHAKLFNKFQSQSKLRLQSEDEEDNQQEQKDESESDDEFSLSESEDSVEIETFETQRTQINQLLNPQKPPPFKPLSKIQTKKLHKLVKQNFLLGNDSTFDYPLIDSNPLYDNSIENERDLQDKYFNSDEEQVEEDENRSNIYDY